ncbi:hypothetical protein [Nonomuraea cavernae]|uniref:Uncharacterized protein n=1 Tax=Nonomuraea cavernae TaxID=2045107 RepID=A0A917YZB1_9ACTN|nr:hypothetical protein [Nonomuraea cavernae]MCA2187461.1 hypothetical protein [Nonomuraea cavernae]GGO68693.1 hypothetical protein GCM10012289_28060 [Nonomuraea cavernae]
MSVIEAARNNAEWCEAVCRTHGITGVFGPRAWTSPVRTPLYYPDAVTLSPEATAGDVLDAVDQGPGASVKDSFATLDLRPAGFEVLFEAQWIHRPAPDRETGHAEVVWEVVRDPATLAAWERACFPGEDGGLFRPELLIRPDLAVLAGRLGGELVCGSVLNLSGRVAGVSNVFAHGCPEDTAWAGTIALAAELFPGRALAGYEGDVTAAVRHGFAPIGPLRVWLKA